MTVISSVTCDRRNANAANEISKFKYVTNDSLLPYINYMPQLSVGQNEMLLSNDVFKCNSQL